MTGNPLLLVIVAGIMFAVLGGVTLLSHIYSLNGIKSKTVGDGQHGTARWATKAEIKKSYTDGLTLICGIVMGESTDTIIDNAPLEASDYVIGTVE